MNRQVSLFVAAIALATLIATDVRAQCDGCDSLVQNWQSSDTTFLVIDFDNSDSSYTELPGNIVNHLTPAFQYDYETDSTHVRFRFSEFSINSHQLFLASWCNNQVINYDDVGDSVITNWTQAELNARSLTRSFPISSGDTIRYYKSSSFIKRGTTNSYSYNYYKNPDILSYSVEIIDSTTGARIALLDTVYLGSTMASRKPCMQSWYPMYSRVTYIMPAGYSDSVVHLRMNTFSSGSSAKSWVRTDKLVGWASGWELSNSAFTDYGDSVEANIDCSVGSSCEVSASSSSSPPGISVLTASGTSLTSIEVYDIYGTLKWSHPVPLTTNPTTVVLASGLYIVVGKINSSAVCAVKVYAP